MLALHHKMMYNCFMINEEIVLYIKTMVFNVTNKNNLEKEKCVQYYGLLFVYLWQGFSLEYILLRLSNIDDITKFSDIFNYYSISQNDFDDEAISIFLNKCRNAKKCLKYLIEKLN